MDDASSLGSQLPKLLLPQLPIQRALTLGHFGITKLLMFLGNRTMELESSTQPQCSLEAFDGCFVLRSLGKGLAQADTVRREVGLTVNDLFPQHSRFFVLAFIETQIPLELKLVQFVGSMLFFECFRLQLPRDFKLASALVHLAEPNQGIGECISRLFVLRFQVHGSLKYLDGLIVSPGR
jgi:hypothetical protein